MTRYTLILMTNGEQVDVLEGPGGLALALLIGVVLVVLIQFLRKKTQKDFGAGEIVFFLVPIATWLLLGGHVSKLSFAGVEFEAGQAILAAAREPIEKQVREVDEVVDEIEPAHREAKGSTSAIPDLVARRVEALEFRLGLGGYYVGSAIREYLETLTRHPFFHYVVIFDERGGLFGLFDEEDLMASLDSRRRDGFLWFADALNASTDEAREEIAAIPGFVPGRLAVTPRAPKRDALEAMESNDVDLLPVVSLERGFVGVVERERLTASLILDVASALEGKQ